MINISDSGNTTIRLATGADGQTGLTKWTVYTYLPEDPTFQNIEEPKYNRIRDLSVVGIKERDDLIGKK